MEVLILFLGVICVIRALPVDPPLDDYPPQNLPLPEPPVEEKSAIFTPYLYGFPYNYLGFPYNHRGFPYDNDHGYPAGAHNPAPAAQQGIYNVHTEPYGCPKDGLFYRNEFSFYSCFGGDSRVMTCAPGSRNLPRESYGEYGSESKTARFCDVNMLSYGFQFPGHKSPLPHYGK